MLGGVPTVMYVWTVWLTCTLHLTMDVQLSKRLVKAEAELQALRMSQLRMESVATTKTATQNACMLLCCYMLPCHFTLPACVHTALIEKLYSAQKDRDKAVEEERLSTTKKLSQVEKQLQKERAKQNR